MFTQPIDLAAMPDASRRDFLKLSAAATGGLVIGAYLAGTKANAAVSAADGPNFTPFIRIAADSTVTVYSKHLDKGQGAATGLATLVAEELDAAREQMRVGFAPANTPVYKNLAFNIQGTGGSTAIANSFAQYRNAGATARAMLVAAASKTWGVAESAISVSGGRITGGSRSASFGELAEAAAAGPVPDKVALKTPDQWVYFGKEFPRLDTEIKTTGAPGAFGMDLKLDDMLVAVTARPPRWGAKLKSFDATAAKAVRGVVDVIRIPQGVTVLAKSTWPAIKARDALEIDWDFSASENISTDALETRYRALADTKGLEFRRDGDAEQAIAGAARTVEATMSFPHLAHAPMEPIDIAVLLKDGKVTFWTGSQLQTVDQGVAAQVLGIKPQDVEINTLWAGGSFGRRAIYDSHYIAEAAFIAKTWGKPQPIKLIYTREDDIQGGYYRPMYVHKVRAGLDDDGKLVGWHHRIVGQSILTGTPFESFLVKNGIDHSSVEGVSDASYAIPNLTGELHSPKVGVPGLWWRSVGHTHTAYAVETMIDRAAKVAGQDPVAYRLELLKGDARKTGVLKLAAEKANWGSPLPAGRHRGVAVHKSFNTYVAEIAEISMRDDGTVKVEKVWCAVDCGIAVNPDVIRAQMEGGIGYGLGAILRNEITLTNGEVEQANFDTYEPLRMEDMPDIEVHIVPSAADPTGVGEPGTPPIGPAVANAIAAATGKWPDRLPLTKQDLA